MLVFDGTKVRIPGPMGTPKADQMQGTEREKLAELAGRVCYDSLGKGRSSLEFHQHVRDVGHLSVYEHCVFTLLVPDYQFHAADFLNRPGLYAQNVLGNWRVTMNLRTILDWQNHGDGTPPDQELIPVSLFPMTFPNLSSWEEIVEPEDDHECWVSIYMHGSRGFSHEQVRHKYEIAVSQRSTRYCDESDSAWYDHPLLKDWLVSEDIDGEFRGKVLLSTEMMCKRTYDAIVNKLQPWLVAKGLDKLTARKQARGAARGYLGNALGTEMIFSASVWQWNWMIKNRFSPAADAEIREIYRDQVIPALMESRYKDRIVIP